MCVLSLAHGTEQRGSDICLHFVKKLSGKFSLNSARVCVLVKCLSLKAPSALQKQKQKLTEGVRGAG